MRASISRNAAASVFSIWFIRLAVVLAIALASSPEFGRASESQEDAQTVLGDLIAVHGNVRFAEGRFSYQESKDGVLTEQLHGTFKVRRDRDRPPRFELAFFEMDGQKRALIASDGKNVVVTRWNLGADSSSPQVEQESASVFRGGVALLQKSGFGVASQYLHDGYLEQIKYYQPAREDHPTNGQTGIKIAIPSKTWRYYFDPNENQLATLKIESVSDGQEIVQTTRYSDVSTQSTDESLDHDPIALLTQGALEQSKISGGPFDSLLGKDVSDTKVRWSQSDAGSIKDQSGKVVVIDFWASWCGPCLKELPAFVELSSNFSEDEVTFVCSPWHDTNERAMVTANKLGFADLVHDVSPDPFPLGETGIPCTFVIDPKGKITDFIIGSHGAAGKAHLKTIIERTVRAGR